MSSRVLIIGSCVSRDAFELPEGKSEYTLSEYVARTSLVSGLDGRRFRRPFRGVDTAAIESPFQRRMVEWDLSGTKIVDLLRAGEFDLVLLDLIDERFDLVRQGRRYATRSNEFTRSGFVIADGGGELVRARSEEKFALWVAAWERFIGLCEHYGVSDRLRVNAVSWATRLDGGDPLPPRFPPAITEAANRELARMYAVIEERVPREQFLSFSPDLMEAATEHKWGVGPFHYVDRYYDALLAQLRDPVAA